MSYFDFIRRNSGYISQEVQEKMSQTRVLIAGCGIGSSPAIALTRMGFKKFRLIDPDTVDQSNLNRQFFENSDLGTLKVEALKKRILAIAPWADVETVSDFMNYENAAKHVQGVGFVIDSIDFISLSGILSMHDEIRKQNLPCLTVFGLGWGAGGMFFSEKSEYSFRKAFSIPEHGQLPDSDYHKYFIPVFQKLAPQLDPSVVQAMAQVMQQMQEGRPCPAPQISSGSWACGHFAAFIVAKYFAGEFIPSAPEFLIYNPTDVFKNRVNLLKTDPNG